jgi:hypothetical protein
MYSYYARNSDPGILEKLLDENDPREDECAWNRKYGMDADNDRESTCHMSMAKARRVTIHVARRHKPSPQRAPLAATASSGRRARPR